MDSLYKTSSAPLEFIFESGPAPGEISFPGARYIVSDKELQAHFRRDPFMCYSRPEFPFNLDTVCYDTHAGDWVMKLITEKKKRGQKKKQDQIFRDMLFRIRAGCNVTHIEFPLKERENRVILNLKTGNWLSPIYPTCTELSTRGSRQSPRPPTFIHLLSEDQQTLGLRFPTLSGRFNGWSLPEPPKEYI